MSDTYPPAHFAAEAIDCLQFLNEIGGPEGEDFISTLRMIQTELAEWERACMTMLKNGSAD